MFSKQTALKVPNIVFNGYDKIPLVTTYVTFSLQARTSCNSSLQQVDVLPQTDMYIYCIHSNNISQKKHILCRYCNYVLLKRGLKYQYWTG